MATPTRELRTLSVCSGAAGLELGLRLAGLPTRVVGYVEREVSVVDILAARFEDGTLEPAPVWSDVRTVRAVLDAFGPIDAIVGGYPCQPFSHAGRRAGADDPRHLWPAIRDLVERVGPALCVFENVDGHVTKGLDVVVGDLEDLGYVVEAEIVSAAEVGAPHLRKRLFVVAYRDAPGRSLVGSGGLLDRFRPPFGDDPDRQSGPSVAALVHPADAVGRSLGVVLDGRSEWLDGDGQADGRSRVADAALAVFPPGPEDYAAWERVLADDATLTPALPDLAGRSGKEVLAAQPDLRRVANELADRLDEHFANRAERLQALGNGVVPACAGVAVSVLLARIARRLGGVA